MRHILAIANQKGGVGKTTTSINLSTGLALAGRRVMLIDLDGQGNATMGSGIDKNQLESTVGTVLLKEAPLEQVTQKTEFGYDLLPANTDLADAETVWRQQPRRYSVLSDLLARHATDYHHIVIDCPPGLNLFTVGSLIAADGLLVPMQCEYFALEGLSDLLLIIKHLRAQIKAKVELTGILRTMFDPRNKLTLAVSEQLDKHFPKQVLATTIPRNVSLAEAPGFGQPIQFYEPNSKGAHAYQSLTKEFINRLKI